MTWHVVIREGSFAWLERIVPVPKMTAEEAVRHVEPRQDKLQRIGPGDKHATVDEVVCTCMVVVRPPYETLYSLQAGTYQLAYVGRPTWLTDEMEHTVKMLTVEAML